MQCYDPHDEDPANIRWLPRWPAWCALIVSFCTGATVNALIGSPTFGLVLAGVGIAALIGQVKCLEAMNELRADEIEALRGEIDILNMRSNHV